MFTWIVENPWIFWLIVFVALLGIEMLTLDFIFLMLSGGALAALLLSFGSDNFVLQVVVFTVVALLLLFFVRPWALRRLRRHDRSTESNVDRLLGSTGTVLNPVDRSSGLVRLAGDTWSARTTDDQVLEPGTEVVVHQIDGATAVVSLEPWVQHSAG